MRSGPASLYSSLLVLGLSPPGSSAGLPWPGRPCDMYTALPPCPRCSNSVAPLPLAHVDSSGEPPHISPPSPPRPPCTGPVPSIDPCRWGHPPLYVSCTPPQTDSTPPGRVGRPCRLSSRHYSAGPPYQTGRKTLQSPTPVDSVGFYNTCIQKN